MTADSGLDLVKEREPNILGWIILQRNMTESELIRARQIVSDTFDEMATGQYQDGIVVRLEA